MLGADFQAAGQTGTSQYGAVLINPNVGGNNPTNVSDGGQLNWFGTVRGRVGITNDRWLVYATGGLAYGRVTVNGLAAPLTPTAFTGFITNAPFLWDNSQTKVGWTVGGGIENSLGGNLSWKIEYLYMDLGSVSAAVSGGLGTGPLITGNCYGSINSNTCSNSHNLGSGSITSKFTDSIGRLGLNLKLF